MTYQELIDTIQSHAEVDEDILKQDVTIYVTQVSEYFPATTIGFNRFDESIDYGQLFVQI